MSDKQPLVSVLIPLYNAEKYISETLNNCLAQTYPNIEIIIVDDGSTDNGLNIARSYASKHENIKVYEQLNSGAPRARNVAFEKSSGEFIQYLDADDLMSEDKISAQMELVNRYGDEHIYTAKYIHFKERPGDEPYLFQKIDRSFESGLDWLIASWSGGGFGTIMGWLTHRRFIEQAGKWDESLKKNQDGEFFCRVLILTKKVIFCEGVTVYYRRTGGSISQQFKEVPAKANLESYRLYEKHMEHIQHPKLKKALAYNYLFFILYYYPHFPLLLQEAEEAIKRLGFNYFSLNIPGKLGIVSKIIGSKNTIRSVYLFNKFVNRERYKKIKNMFNKLWICFKECHLIGVLYSRMKLRRMLIIPYRKTYLYIDPAAEVSGSGKLFAGIRWRNNRYIPSQTVLHHSSKLVLNGVFRVYTGHQIAVSKGAVLILGDNTYCDNGLKLACFDSIQIGDNVKISENVTIRDSDNHTLGNENPSAPIKIGNNVWIGINVTILKGVTIGEGAVIAAGSVVTSDVPSKTQVFGVPAEVVRENVEWKI